MAWYNDVAAWGAAPFTAGASLATNSNTDQFVNPLTWGDGLDPVNKNPGGANPFPKNPYGNYPTYQSYGGQASMSGAANPWAQMALNSNELNFGTQEDNLRADQQGRASTAMDAAAVQGGLSGGGAERIQSRANRDLMTGLSDLGRKRDLADLQVGATGAQQNLDLSKFNTALAADQNQQQNNYNLEGWKGNSGIWAAMQLAQAQQPKDDGQRWYDPTSWFK